MNTEIIMTFVMHQLYLRALKPGHLKFLHYYNMMKILTQQLSAICIGMPEKKGNTSVVVLCPASWRTCLEDGVS